MNVSSPHTTANRDLLEIWVVYLLLTTGDRDPQRYGAFLSMVFSYYFSTSYSHICTLQEKAKRDEFNSNSAKTGLTPPVDAWPKQPMTASGTGSPLIVSRSSSQLFLVVQNVLLTGASSSPDQKKFAGCLNAFYTSGGELRL